MTQQLMDMYGPMHTEKRIFMHLPICIFKFYLPYSFLCSPFNQ